MTSKALTTHQANQSDRPLPVSDQSFQAYLPGPFKAPSALPFTFPYFRAGDEISSLVGRRKRNF
jgi:hypothetical protein